MQSDLGLLVLLQRFFKPGRNDDGELDAVVADGAANFRLAGQRHFAQIVLLRKTRAQARRMVLAEQRVAHFRRLGVLEHIA